ncbi:MAG: metal ABC transporter ATP-binding protein [Eubacteriales bacterium]|nr:metal ABC transporter ATP-binding protein [Eubacteriales bacterium]
MNIIETKHLFVEFGETQALTDVNLQVQEGDYVAIIGPNGGGKTTLLNSIIGLQKPCRGNVQLFGKTPTQARTHVGFVPQFGKMNKRFPISVHEAVLTGALKSAIHPFFRYSAQDKAQAMEKLEQLGIAHLHNRQISKLSGGEFQRMLIARALMNNPRLLLLDEPTSSIDPQSRELIYALLKDFNKQGSIVMVSHDLVAVSSHVKSIVCLNKNLIYHGEPELSENTVQQLYGCPVDLIAHGVPHRVLKHHHHEGCNCV